jgi:hypothetical protein
MSHVLGGVTIFRLLMWGLWFGLGKGLGLRLGKWLRWGLVSYGGWLPPKLMFEFCIPSSRFCCSFHALWYQWIEFWY